jgi:hypothetical protein
MIRYTLFLAAVLGTAATAIASVKPADRFALTDPTAISIFYKTDATPALQHVVLAKCAIEDCSDTPQ